MSAFSRRSVPSHPTPPRPRGRGEQSAFRPPPQEVRTAAQQNKQKQHRADARRGYLPGNQCR
jgi:hypothetical protein